MGLLAAKPSQRDVTVSSGAEQAASILMRRLQDVGAKDIRNDQGVLRGSLGSYLLTRMVGAAFLKPAKLPRSVAVGFTPLGASSTQVTVVVGPPFGSSLTVGAPRKMQRAIDEAADAIVEGLA